jgi:miniconductance mechanosensitive channel
MPQTLNDFLQHPWVQPTLVSMMLVIGALFGTLIARRLLLRGIEHVLTNTQFGRDDELRQHRVIPRLANIVPALFVLLGIELVAEIPSEFTTIVVNVVQAFIILTVAMALSGAIAVGDTVYHRIPRNRLRPIKGYLQILRIAVYLVATVLMVAALFDKSPVILLSGLGAMAAVIILIFQDTLLSFVASIQISLNDMVRVGDWVEMPDFKADGEVIEIALHTIKIQNWDNTVSTIPIRNIVTHSFKNWRAMQESGGRRIKRALHIDQGSIRFLAEDEIAKLSQLRLLHDHIATKRAEIEDWNSRLDPAMSHEANTRRLTNIGMFRAYADNYLRQHVQIRGDMIQMVRQLAPGPKGLPLEIYAFTNTTSWVAYESIQADVFDHLISVAPSFGLRIFQEPAGSDLAGISGAFSRSAA